MSNCVRIPVHHQESVFSARDYQMLCVITRTPRRCKEIAVARFLLKVLHAPRSPERFYFLLWKFFLRHRWIGFSVGEAASFRSRRVDLSMAKSSQHFYLGSALAPRVGDRVLAITNFEVSSS